MDYLWVKYLHVSCVVISISLFVLCGSLQLQFKPWRQWWLLRVAPHIIDSVLLGSALWLAWRSAQYPFVEGWLTAKVLALIAYIVLGTIALKRGKTKGVRAFAMFAALATFAYIVAVALTRQAAIPLQALGLAW